MSKKRVIQIIAVVLAAPYACFFFYYTTRWVLTGKWVEGGGDRAVLGFMISLVVGAFIALSEIE